MTVDDLFCEPLATIGSNVVLYMLRAQASVEKADRDEPSEFGNGRTIAQEMESLITDLARLEAGWVPGPAELGAAPEFQDWGILDAGERLPKIWGAIDDVCKLGTSIPKGHRVITLPILARDKALTWVRDRRGFYRLGDCSVLTRSYPCIAEKSFAATKRRPRLNPIRSRRTFR